MQQTNANTIILICLLQNCRVNWYFKNTKFHSSPILTMKPILILASSLLLGLPKKHFPGGFLFQFLDSSFLVASVLLITQKCRTILAFNCSHEQDMLMYIVTWWCWPSVPWGAQQSSWSHSAVSEQGIVCLGMRWATGGSQGVLFQEWYSLISAQSDKEDGYHLSVTIGQFIKEAICHKKE